MHNPDNTFRLWMLLLYAMIGVAFWTLYIAYLSNTPPNREYLGDYGYRYAWTLIVLTGAFGGGFCYVATWLRVRKSK
jgi:hypothetical protein